jgi:hypothetical protein
MSSSEEKRENGSVMMVMGWVLVLFSLLVFYFHPAAIRLGEIRFALIAGGLAGPGLILATLGAWVRRQNR